MATTPELISSIATGLKPVRRLPPPGRRAFLWVLGAAMLLALLAIGQGIRPDLALKLGQPNYAVMLAGVAATALTAALAAFMLSVPGRSAAWALLPLPAVTVWVGNIGYQCLTDWVVLDPSGISWGETARCLATLALTSVPLSAGLLVMLRHAIAFRTAAVALSGSLAVSAMTVLALFLFHSLDASVMVLMWNFGTTALIVALSTLTAARHARKAQSPAFV